MVRHWEEAREALESAAIGFDPAQLTPDDAVRALEELARMRAVIDGLVGKIGKRIQDTAAHLEHGAPDAAALLGRILGMPARSARATITTAAALESLPTTDAAVRAGQLSAHQAEMIVKTARIAPDSESQLLATAHHGLTSLRDACIAARASVETADQRRQRQHRARTFRVWTDDDGMVSARLRLTPERGGRLKALVDKETQRIFRSQRSGPDHDRLDAIAADAFVNLMMRGGAVNAQVHIVIDHGALVRGGAVDGERCEIMGVGPVDVEWVRSLLGEAFLTAVIKRGKDIVTVAHLGRHVPAEVQTALLVSGRECDIDGCHGRGYLERHHLDERRNGGVTSLWNLTWLCYNHHVLTKKGWELSAPDRTTGKRSLRAPPSRAA